MPICILFLAGCTMWAITLVVFDIFRKWGVVDKPHLYPHEKGREALPYPGGVVLILNMILWSPWILQSVADADVKNHSTYFWLVSLQQDLWLGMIKNEQYRLFFDSFSKLS